MKRRTRILLRLALSASVGLLLLEFGLRTVLFSEAAWTDELGGRLRKELLFADARNEDDCWKLRAIFGGEKALWPHPNFDAELGWRRHDLAPETCVHPEMDKLGSRRPVLFYGDSFVECATEASDCWPSLLERSNLGQRLAMLNYGTGGYGLGQMLLLMRRTLDHHAPRPEASESAPTGERPIVMVGLLIDDDLDRSSLSLRNFPKPRFRIEADTLVLELPEPDTAAYLEARPLAINSYLWRYFLYGSGLVPDRVRWVINDEEEERDAKRALNRRLIEAMRDELESRGLDYFFVLFHGPSSIWTRAPYSWQEPFLYGTLGELGIPFVSSKRALMSAFEESQLVPHDYFMHEGGGKNHYNARGNEAVFAAIRDGLEGRFESADFAAYLAGTPVHPRDRAR